MRLAEVSPDGFMSDSKLAVWSDSKQGWVFVSDLLKNSGKDTRYLSVSLMLYRDTRETEVCMDDIRNAIDKLDKEGADEIRVYRPGVDRSSFGKLFMSPKKILCVGLNYAEHAREFGDPLPGEPVIFNKAPSALNYCGGDICIPKVSNRVDYEGELVVVIGKTCRNASIENAMDYVAGYCCGNDVSARDWQKDKPAGQWFLGKSFDSFAVVGPYMVTPDEVGDPNNLHIETRLNGEVVQSSNTNCFIFKIEYLISYLSQVMTLSIGDLIYTGTPNGVGDARNPPVYLKRGDEVVVEIEKVGKLINYVY